MNTFVAQVDATTLSYLHTQLTPYIVATPQYAVFQAKTQHTTITAYKSGKVVLQGKFAQQIAEKFQLTSSLSPCASNTSSVLPKQFSIWSVMGSDEVGTGSYLGPVVVASAFVDKKTIPLLQQAGVQDSKNLSDTAIRELSQFLKQNIPYKTLTVSPEKYNETHNTYNMNQIKALLHNRALYLLSTKIDHHFIDAYLIDEFCAKKTYYRYVADEEQVIEDRVYFATKGESHHIAVAAASIIARAAFLDYLDTLSTEFGMTIPSGAGEQSDVVAANILQRYGLDGLKRIAKLHFANTEKVFQLAGLPKTDWLHVHQLFQ